MLCKSVTVRAVGAAVAVGLALLAGCDGQRGATRAQVLEVDEAAHEYLSSLTITPFEMTDQDGRVVDEGVLEGGWTVLSFNFTNCPTVCPTMFSHMSRLYYKVDDLPVRFVSVSVDPVNDTPEKLRAYGESMGLDFDDWTMLSADEATLRQLVAEDLSFALRETEEAVILASGERVANIAHPTKFLLVNPDGVIEAMYSGMEPTGADTLGRVLRRLAARGELAPS